MEALKVEAERKEQRIQQLTRDSERFAQLLSEAEERLAKIMANWMRARESSRKLNKL